LRGQKNPAASISDDTARDQQYRISEADSKALAFHPLFKSNFFDPHLRHGIESHAQPVTSRSATEFREKWRFSPFARSVRSREIGAHCYSMVEEGNLDIGRSGVIQFGEILYIGFSCAI
jgi:hypothetical protein